MRPILSQLPAVISRRWRALPPLARDAAPPIVLLLGTVVPGLAHNGVALGELAPRNWDALSVILILAQSVPLIVARTRPALAFWVVAAAFAVFQCRGYQPAFAGLGMLIVPFFVGYRPGKLRRWFGVAAIVGYIALAGTLIGLGSPEHVVDFATFFVVPLVSWALGVQVRLRGVAGIARANREAEQAILGERRRLASELHDIVSHHVTAMVVQSDVGELLTSSPNPSNQDPRIAAAFSLIGDSGRRALSDLRQLLAVLSDGSPTAELRPQLTGLAELIEGVRRGGQEVHLDDQLGHATLESLSDAAQLAAFRLIQEGLTNAMKHAAGQTIRVELSAGEDNAYVKIENALPPDLPSGPPINGSGHGLVGLRERFDLLGGSLKSESRAGSFIVWATIPCNRHYE